MTPTSAFIAVVQETVAVFEPDGGLMTWKIIVRMVLAVPESVPGTNVAATPPRLAAMLVAVLALIATMMMAARFAPVPMVKAGVVIELTPKLNFELTLLSKATPATLTVSAIVTV